VNYWQVLNLYGNKKFSGSRIEHFKIKNSTILFFLRKKVKVVWDTSRKHHSLSSVYQVNFNRGGGG